MFGLAFQCGAAGEMDFMMVKGERWLQNGNIWWQVRSDEYESASNAKQHEDDTVNRDDRSNSF
jgi:hypothetical protein